MDLREALRFLADVHTRDDDVTGFVVQMAAMPMPWHPEGAYVDAWETVRKELGLPTDPPRGNAIDRR